MKQVLAVLIVLMGTIEAQACSCGRTTYARCTYCPPQAKIYKVTDTKVVTQVVPTQTINIVNAQPVGAVGSAAYAYTQAAAPYVDTAAYYSHHTARSQDNTAALIEGFGQRAAEQNRDAAITNRILATGQAMSQFVTASNPEAQAQSPQVSYQSVTTYPDGSIRTQTINPRTLQPTTQATGGQAAAHAQQLQQQATTQATGGATPVTTSNCVSCHGPTVQKKGIRFDQLIDHKLAMRALDQVRSNKMPEGGPPLSDAQKAAFMEEMFAKVKEFEAQQQQVDPPPSP